MIVSRFKIKKSKSSKRLSKAIEKIDKIVNRD